MKAYVGILEIMMIGALLVFFMGSGVVALQSAQASQPPDAEKKGRTSEASSETRPAQDEGEGATARFEKEAASAEGDQKEDPKARREPTPTEILEMLQRERAPRQGVLTVPSRPNDERTSLEVAPPNAIQPVARRLLPDGSRIVDRPGRLVRQDDYFVYSFESRGQGPPEMPMRLLPNRLLEDMEIYSEGGTKPAVYVISGEVTEYRGVNYLLIQKLLVQPDMDNLK